MLENSLYEANYTVQSLIKRRYAEELGAEVVENADSVVWSTSSMLKCVRCGKRQEVIYTLYNDPQADSEVNSTPRIFHDENELDYWCKECVDKFKNEMAEIIDNYL